MTEGQSRTWLPGEKVALTHLCALYTDPCPDLQKALLVKSVNKVRTGSGTWGGT